MCRQTDSHGGGVGLGGLQRRRHGSGNHLWRGGDTGEGSGGVHPGDGVFAVSQSITAGSNRLPAWKPPLSEGKGERTLAQ